MADYTERFRTLSIPQMQQVLALLCAHVEDTTPDYLVFYETMSTILSQQDNRACDQQFAGKESSETVDPTIIRAAEGVTLEPGDYISLDHEDLTFGLERLRSPVNRNGRMCWLVDGGGFEVTAVRRVDPKPASEPVAPSAGKEVCMCGHTRDWHFNFNERCARLVANKQCECVCFDFRDKYGPPQQPAERVGNTLLEESLEHRLSLAVERLEAAEATVTKLTAELEAANSAQLALANLFGMVHEPDSGPTWPASWDALLDRVAQLHQAESARARLDPKACGELIAKLRVAVNCGLEYDDPENDARFYRDTPRARSHALIDKLAAMLGVETQP